MKEREMGRTFSTHEGCEMIIRIELGNLKGRDQSEDLFKWM
jgi:hypothetical protein